MVPAIHTMAPAVQPMAIFFYQFNQASFVIAMFGSLDNDHHLNLQFGYFRHELKKES
jgi:hypothetical protein